MQGKTKSSFTHSMSTYTQPVPSSSTLPSINGTNNHPPDLSAPALLSSPQGPSSQMPGSPNPDTLTPRSSLDDDVPASGRDRISQLESELLSTRQEKEGLSNQYRSLLGKLTAMRQSLGDKLREDAVSLGIAAIVGGIMSTLPGRTR
jgi:hypothetical protein